jgi:hypothetical protein
MQTRVRYVLKTLGVVVTASIISVLLIILLQSV